MAILLLPIVYPYDQKSVHGGEGVSKRYQKRLLALAAAYQAEHGPLKEKKPQKALKKALQETEHLERKMTKGRRSLSQLFFAILVLFGVPTGSLALYESLGRPDLRTYSAILSPQRPHSLLTLPSSERMSPRAFAALERAHVQQLLSHFSWRLLGLEVGLPTPKSKDFAFAAQLYAYLGSYRTSADLWEQAAEQEFFQRQQRGYYRTRAAEMLIAAQHGHVTEDAFALLQQARLEAPNDPRLLFYLGLHLEQTGRLQEALALWLPLSRTQSFERGNGAPAIWQAALRDYIEMLAIDLGVEVAALLPRHQDLPEPVPNQAQGGRGWDTMASGPQSLDLAAAMALSPEERMAFVRGLIQSLRLRLASTPEDKDGWQRLGQSYQVLGQHAQARAAFSNAAALTEDNVELLMDYARAILAHEGAAPPAPPELLATLKKIIALNPLHQEALYHLALSAEAREDKASARLYWERLLPLLDPGSPQGLTAKRHLEDLRN